MEAYIWILIIGFVALLFYLYIKELHHPHIGISFSGLGGFLILAAVAWIIPFPTEFLLYGFATGIYSEISEASIRNSAILLWVIGLMVAGIGVIVLYKGGGMVAVKGKVNQALPVVIPKRKRR